MADGRVPTEDQIVQAERMAEMLRPLRPDLPADELRRQCIAAVLDLDRPLDEDRRG